MLDTARPRLLNEDAAAEFLGVTARTLQAWRSEKRYSLRYVKVGRLVRYEQTDLMAFLESRKVTNTPVQGRSRRRGR